MIFSKQPHTANNNNNFSFAEKNGTPPLVMLIDDSDIDNFVNKNMLKRYGFSDRILAFEKASEALEYLEDASNEVPEFIFLDLNMPEISGFDFMEKFQELPFPVKSNCDVVVLSSSYDPRDKAKIMQHDHTLAYFSKPLIKSNVDELLMKIDRLVAA